MLFNQLLSLMRGHIEKSASELFLFFFLFLLGNTCLIVGLLKDSLEDVGESFHHKLADNVSLWAVAARYLMKAELLALRID